MRACWHATKLDYDVDEHQGFKKRIEIPTSCVYDVQVIVQGVEAQPEVRAARPVD